MKKSVFITILIAIWHCSLCISNAAELLSASNVSSKSPPVDSDNDTCTFLDHKEYSDLLSTVNSLQKAISEIPQGCVNSSAGNAYAEVQALKDNASKISEYWNSNAVNPTSPDAFGQSVQGAVTSLKNIGNNLQSSSLNEVCNAHFSGSKGAEFFSKLTDVGVNLGPMLILAKVMVPTMPLSMPVVIGAVGVLSVVNIATQMAAKDEINIRDPKQQRMILKTVCDYRRVKKQMDYITFIQGGSNGIERAEKQLDERSKELEAGLPANLKEKYLKYKSDRSANGKNDESLKNARDLLTHFDQIFRKDNSDAYICSVGKKLFKDSNPVSAIKASEFKLENKTDPSAVSISLLMDNADRLSRSVLVLDVSDDKKVEMCATKVKHWRGIAASLFREIDSLIQDSIDSKLTELLKDPDFPEFLGTVDKDRIFFKRVLNFMKRETNPGAMMSKSMAYAQIEEIHSFLLGRGRAKFAGLNRITLVGEWLSYMKDRYIGNVGQFNTSFLRLENDLKSALAPFASQAKKVLPNGQPVRFAVERLNSKDVNAKKDKVLWAETCSALKDLNILWDRADTHQKAVGYFCDTISDIRDTQMNYFIVETCYGNLGVKKTQMSWLQETRILANGPVDIVYKAGIISQKLIELGCPVPTKD